MKMIFKTNFLAVCISVVGVLLNPITEGWAQQLYRVDNIPGLVIGLTHTNQGPLKPRPYLKNAVKLHGGDIGAKKGQGFSWYALNRPKIDWSAIAMERLPPGLVVALKHSRNQANMRILAFNQYDAVNGPLSFPGFVKRHGGDLGAPAGVGFYWYESIDTGNTDWSLIDRFPKGTIIGLRHSENLSGGRDPIAWPDKYAPRTTFKNPIPTYIGCDVVGAGAPPGFKWHGCYDIGAKRYEGFCWYEKIF